MPPTRRVTVSLTTILVAAGLLLAACGDDDSATATGGSGSNRGDLAAFCDAALAIATPPDPDVDFETASEGEIAEAARVWAAAVMRPLADDVVATAPAELAGDVDVLSSAIDEVADSGDFSALEASEVESAGDRFD
ncbi:MAG: hypothetical protein ACRD0U_15310, partial [Acidimicrobiales bacterium]